MSGQLKEVRERITSVKSTQQITKAMKMVSAAKLRKAQQAITEMRPYADRLNKMLKNILSNLEGDANSAFGVEREVNNVAIAIVTSSKGLCGAFNANITKAAVAKIEGEYAEQLASGNITIVGLGKKGYEVLTKKYPNLKFVDDHVGIFSDLNFDTISAGALHLMNGFIDGTYDKVDVCYGQFKNAALQFPKAVQFLPVPKMEKAEGASKTKADYIFEPTKQELLESLIPSILQTTFQKYVLDTHASEHGARMTAMDSATENAEELMKELKISYNKARQEAITKELSEIVGGAAALEG
ncbi:MAG: ATP synthase F1 subunit gamma [Saprospiraceae bacterium]|nr:ATP synthase F1 subunit gamma [Saprospiraceae bacterium]